MTDIEETELQQLEREHAAGMTSADILEYFRSHGISFGEATLRKYVQLGLLPRSVRVGRKGKHQGSQGVYPVAVVRQIVRIKGMMAQSYTIDQIQKQFLFIRNDIEQLEQALRRIFCKLDDMLKERQQAGTTQAVSKEVEDARHLGREVVARLEAIENKLSSRSELEEVAVS